VQSLNLTILSFGVTNEAIHYLDTNICFVISMVSLLVTLEEFTTFLSFIIQQRCCVLDVATWKKKLEVVHICEDVNIWDMPNYLLVLFLNLYGV
jgi:hypothetical protein